MADSEIPIPIRVQENATEPTSTGQKIDPWNVQGEIDADGVAKAINYNTLIEEFGTKKILPEDLERFEKVTGHKPHRFMRRGIVFSHRDLNVILDRYESGEPFFLYTGRGPSSDSMHIGHTVPFGFTKWLQDVFDVPLVIMMTDDEKYLFSEKRTIEEVMSYTAGNVKDIIAAGFDPKKTFIFSDYDYMGGAFYKNVTRMSKMITYNTAKAVFGFNDSSCIGKIHFGAVQGATSFANSFPHIFGDDDAKTSQIPALIPCAIDQDPYFRLTRDVAARLHFAKPCLIHSRFLDALQGPGSKMSSSVDTSAIFMYDEPNKIKNKINKYAFSGGQETLEEQREKGGDTEKDVSYQYLTFFLEDDEELEKIGNEYRSGKMLTGELKAKCISELQAYVKEFQERRANVTDEVVADFFSTKKLEWKGNPNAIRVAKEGGEVEGSTEGDGKLSKSQLKKIEKEKVFAQRKAEKEAAKAAAKGGGILIGGGWHLPATYSKLTKALEAAGYEVHVPLLPSMNGARPPTASLAEDTTAVRNYVVNLIDAGHTVAAIMHSYGGQVGTNALHGLGLEQHAREGKSGGVSKLIYMCAFALPENSSMIGKVEEMGDSALMPLVFDFDEDGTVVSRDPKTFLVGEGDEKEIEEYVGGFRRWNGKGMYDCIERCAWRDDIPVSYIFAKSDMTVPLRYQEDMVEKVRAEGRSVETYEVDSGHCPNHTKTKEIVEIVGKAVGRK